MTLPSAPDVAEALRLADEGHLFLNDDSLASVLAAEVRRLRDACAFKDQTAFALQATIEGETALRLTVERQRALLSDSVGTIGRLVSLANGLVRRTPVRDMDETLAEAVHMCARIQESSK